ncbi:ribokinase [Clostridia bacterium]|nr:ribokinase [Clostridia bacterium]
MKILVFGSINIDDVYTVEHFAREGETIDSSSYRRHEGGKGLNQSIALAKAGISPYFAGAVGEDGRYLLDFMNSFGVNTDYVKIADVPTGHAIIQVDGAGRNCIILYGGANRSITPDMADGILAGFGAGDCLLMQNEISSQDYIMKAAHARGMRILFNASPIADNLTSMPLELVELFLINEVEGLGLMGRTEPDAILDEMLQLYPSAGILLTLGERGAIFADSTRRVRQAAIPVKAVDSTAAGDTFTGYFVQAMLTGCAVEYALLRAAHAASIAVGRAGAGESVPYAGEVDEALSVVHK